VTRWFYSSLMWLVQPLFQHKLRRRGKREPGYLHAVDERFGRYAGALPPGAGPLMWIHAVSLGETRAAAVLVTALRERLPGLRLLLTHATATGRAEGAKLLSAGDVQVWQPWDTPGAVQRFLAHFKPVVGILMETEVWPNLVAGCRAQGVPLLLVNARLSAKSLRQAQRLAWLARPAYAALTAVWAQTQADADRLRSLGAPVQGVLGNLKFDATPDAVQLAQGRAWRSAFGAPVVMFASSREGEELALLQILKEKWLPAQSNQGPDASINEAMKDALSVQWLIVPRHPQRFDEVATLIQSHGFALSRRSDWGEAGPGLPRCARNDDVRVRHCEERSDAAIDHASNGPKPCIWLGDSLGEMALYYGLADVALLGGSFAPLGGQNLIEAAECGCPVVMGPHTFNFADAAEQAVLAGAALRVADLKEGVTRAETLATENLHRSEVAQASVQFARLHQGAASRLADIVCRYVRPT